MSEQPRCTCAWNNGYAPANMVGHHADCPAWIPRAGALGSDPRRSGAAQEATRLAADPMPVFTIKAKDMLAPEAVEAYRDLCVQYGLDGQAIEVAKALDEIIAWQERNDELVHDPDHAHVPVATDD